MPTKTTEKQNDWKVLVKGFVGDMLERLSDNVSKRVHIFIDQLKRRTIGAILMLIGFVFVLIGLALFINALFSNIYPWVGWSLSGFVVLLAGYGISKSK
jgi:type II secretory pathway component PulF